MSFLRLDLLLNLYILYGKYKRNVKRCSDGQNSINSLSGLFIELLISLVRFNITRRPIFAFQKLNIKILIDLINWQYAIIAYHVHIYYYYYLLLVTEIYFSLIIASSIVQSNVKWCSHGQNSINSLSSLFMIELLISLVRFNIIRFPKTEHKCLDSDKIVVIIYYTQYLLFFSSVQVSFHYLVIE